MGVLFEDLIKQAFGSLLEVGIEFIVTGVILWSTRWVKAPAPGDRLTAGTATAIGGNAWEAPGRIWYQTLTQRLGPRSDFREAAEATTVMLSLFAPYVAEDDPKHRHEWREPYDDRELAAFERFASDGELALGFAISPGLSIDCDDAEDRAALAAKVDQVVSVGARQVVLALDDIPFGGGPQSVVEPLAQ